MNELVVKLKEAIIHNLQKQITEENKDKPYLVSGQNSYTLNELIHEVENETDKGLNLITGVINLTIDLLHRGKKEFPESNNQSQ